MHSPGAPGLHWFYVREGRRVGPLDRSPLIAQLLTLDTPEAILVWRTGLPAWTKAGLLDELRGELPPPLPGSLPGQGLLDFQAPGPLAPEGPDEEALPPLPAEAPLSDGDFAGDQGQGNGQGQEGSTGSAADDEAGKRRRRRHRHRPSGPSRLPSYLPPLILLFVAVMLGLWFLLRRMNEPPPGQILRQGALAPTRGRAPAPESTGSLPVESRA